MSYEELSLSGFIKEIKDVSEGTHPRKFCFVLGAGASRSSGVKSGQDLVKIWDIELRERNIDEYNHWRKKTGITDDNMYSFYSRYYEKRFKRCPSDGYNYIEKIMASAKPSAGYVMLAHILTTSSHNVVVTTNFDHLTEDAVNYYAQETPLVIGHESLAHYVSANPMRPTIIKIHRDLLFDPKSRTEDLEKLADNWKSSLSLIFENYHPIFVGYAGNDNSLMDFLIENTSKFTNDEWKYPYWMLYEGDKLEGKILKFITEGSGYVIYHTGFDDVMIQLGAAFDYKTPPEEEFLNDAKKRYKSLVDAIDAFSEKSKKSEVEVVIENASKTIEVVDENNSSKDGIVAIEKIASQSEMQQQYRLAITEMEKGSYEIAGELLLKLIGQDPNNIRYIRKYGNVLLEQEKLNEALTQFDKALKIDPEDELSHFWRGMVLEEMERYEESLAEYTRALELKPEDDFNHFKVGSILEELGRYEEALESYRMAIELDSSSDFYNFKFGYVLEKMMRYEEALESYKVAIELNPENEINYFKVGNVLEKLKRYEEALESYKVAVELAPQDSINHFKIGNVLEKIKQYEKALVEYRKAVELEPDNSRNHFAVANMLVELERYEEALEEYRISNLIKVDVMNYVAIGRVLEIMKRNDEAIEQYNNALKIDNKKALCYWRLALLYNKMNEYEKALDNIKAAIDIDDTIFGFYETLALIYMNLGIEDKAKSAIEKASSLKDEKRQ